MKCNYVIRVLKEEWGKSKTKEKERLPRGKKEALTHYQTHNEHKKRDGVRVVVLRGITPEGLPLGPI